MSGDPVTDDRELPREPRVPPHHDAGTAVWVHSDRTPSGDYVLAIQYSEDGIFYPKGPAAYARQVISVALRAAYDSAVLAQTRWIGKGDLDDAALYSAVVGPMREDRPPLNDAATDPLVFTPLTAARNGQPYVHVRTTSGADVTQWTFAQALGHAMYVLTAAVAADLDNGYRRQLTGSMGVEPERAAAVIDDLGRFMADFATAGTQDEDPIKMPAGTGAVPDAEPAAAPVSELPPPPEDPQTEPTKLRLTRALRDAGAPEWMVTAAADGYYDEFTSSLTFPLIELVKDASAAGLTVIADRVRNGDFDATKAESAAWAASADGRATFRELIGHQPLPEEDDR